MTLFGSIKELFHSITTPDHYASYSGDRPAGHDAVPLRTGTPSDLYAHGNRSAQLNSAPQPQSDIPMAPIGPSVKVAWKRILEYLDEHYPELHDQVLDGATRRDIGEIENDLDIALPEDVKESMTLHDGQQRGGRPVGLIFGIELLDLESVMEEWSIWRRAAIRVNERDRARAQGAAAGPSSSSSGPVKSLLPRQRSVPAEAIQCVYAHPAWVPLAKDGGGNNIAVDLAPGPQGRAGQIILFGRDFDTKYVIAPSWSHFLDIFATDIQKGNPYVDDNIDNPIFAIRENGRIVHYLDLLRRRVAPRRAPTSPSQVPQVRVSPAPVIKLEPKNKRPSSAKSSQTALGGISEAEPKEDAPPVRPTPTLLEDTLASVNLNEAASADADAAADASAADAPADASAPADAPAPAPATKSKKNKKKKN